MLIKCNKCHMHIKRSCDGLILKPVGMWFNPGTTLKMILMERVMK